ncbi:MAG: hypothetical protein ACI8SR_001638 [Oceanicoccus sp.]|jgi:hypothetical protein
MIKHLLIIMVCSAFTANYVIADEDIDMSSPTEAYTALGTGIGNKGMNLKAMYMLSDPGATRKTGFILEMNDMTDEEGGDPKFAGSASGMSDEVTNTNYRFRYGSLNTDNGLGWTLDAVFKDHPFFGQMSVIQAGPLATLPVNKNTFLWPVLLIGGVITEDNSHKLAEAKAQADTTGATQQSLNTSSNGVDIASLITSFKMYGRYKFSDDWWFLGAYTYTQSILGKSWSDDVADSGLGIRDDQIELTLGYQVTQTQNLRFNFHRLSENESDDKIWVEYLYAF